MVRLRSVPAVTAALLLVGIAGSAAPAGMAAPQAGTPQGLVEQGAVVRRCAAGRVVSPAPSGGPVAGTVFSVPGFDPSFGTLTGVELGFSGVATLVTQASTTSPQGSWNVSRWDNAGVFVTGPGLGALPNQSFAPKPRLTDSGFVSDPMAAVPGDVAGATFAYSYASGPLNVISSPSVGVSHSRDVSGSVRVSSGLSAWTVPSVTLSSATVDGFGLSVTSGNVSGGVTYQVQVTPCVTYTYTPRS